MTDNTDNEMAHSEMTEQIEASFGPMTVFVSGTSREDVQDTFDHVWDRMMDTSDQMHERSRDMDSDGPTKTFGD